MAAGVVLGDVISSLTTMSAGSLRIVAKCAMLDRYMTTCILYREAIRNEVALECSKEQRSYDDIVVAVESIIIGYLI